MWFMHMLQHMATGNPVIGLGLGGQLVYAAQINGQPHDRHFDVHLHLLDRLIGTGSGRSKKEAEENAAREALRQWKTSAQN